MKSFTDTYKEDSVLSMPREQLLLRLYDALLARLGEAQRNVENGDRQVAGRAIGRALAIVTALREALDPSVDADAVPLLDRLYDTVSSWLLEANIQRDKKPLLSSELVIRKLKEGWDGAVAQIQ